MTNTALPDALSRILRYKADEVAARKAARPLAEMRRAAAAADPPRGFLAALQEKAQAGRVGLIAEIKKASPSKGLIRADFDPEALAKAYETGGAACLSVLTDAPSFQGSEEALIAARGAVALPVLRKDFLIDLWQVYESRALGADCILLILAAIDDDLASEALALAADLGIDALVETHDDAEMARAAKLGARLIGINNRDLRSFTTDLSLTAQLARRAPTDALLVSESGIFTRDDVKEVRSAGAQAILVGESLMRASDVTEATRTLVVA